MRPGVVIKIEPTQRGDGMVIDLRPARIGW